MKYKYDYKKIIKSLLVITFVVSIFLLLSNQTVFADVGNNNSYDTGSSDSGDGGDAFWIVLYKNEKYYLVEKGCFQE